METLTAQQVRGIIDGLRKDGYEVGLRDVAYAILATVLTSDRQLGFRAIFGDNPEVPFDVYDHLEKRNKVSAAVCDALGSDATEEKEAALADEVSFDELKQGLIDDMRALEELRDSRNEDGVPLLDAKEMAQVVARIADIRVKLTEKFGTTERIVEKRVVVEQKYNDICPYCHHEIAVRST